MKNSKFILKLAAILFAISFICTLLLVLCNALTEDRIALLKKEAENKAKTDVLPVADTFEAVQAKGVAEAYIGKDSDGNTVGYCFKTEPNGFGGKITIMVGIAADGKVSGVKITNLTETPGLGARATDESWLSQFSRKDGEISVVKAGSAKGNEINAISGATITSKAVSQGVSSAINAAKELMKREANK